MSYPGNPSLSPDVQQRVLSTFEQTLDLAAEGNRQEALLGCDFVLRMDPQFASARTLQERLRSGAGPVMVDDLRAAPAAPAFDPGFGSGSAAADPFTDFGSLSLDLPDLPAESLFGTAPSPGFPPGDLRAELSALLEQRRFPELLQKAEQQMAAVAADPELQRIAATAQERLESEPYVVKFLASARDAQRSGDAKEVERLLAKARSLDPSHPGIAELERSMPAAATAMPSPFGAAPAGAADSYAGGDSESARRIRELLAEGQAAFDGGDPQAAIDAWSRIFLIDIDHQEASRRIEQARKLKAEKERQVEEIFHDGLAAIESRDLERARQSFQQVLALQPGHVTAREYLDQLAAGVVPVVRMTSREMPAVSAEALPTPADFDSGMADDLKEEILVPPDPSEVAAKPRARREPKPITAKANKPWRLFIGVGAAVLLLAAAGLWYLLQNRDSLFPNSQPDESAMAAPASHLVDRAKNQHREGKIDLAMAQLRRVPPTDPRYKEAQDLLAQWSGASPAATRPTGPSPEAMNRRQAFLDQARAAYTERSYLRAVDSFEKAASLGALEGDDAASLADAREQVAPLARFVELYNQHDWEFIVRDLWEMHLKDPGNRDVKRLLVDSYYNLAVVDLQQSDAKSASNRLSEVANLAGDDETLRRQHLFAQTYQDREKDLLYRIYVKYLPFR
ncbi:MAG TPA: hypothetical protein VEL74_06905 [Thermoanaerobaculia bacterium]|nr:hypothetical protein [Thermoanaerobaculia bacterium]